MTDQPTAAIVSQRARQVAATIYQNFRDHDYATWIMNGTNAGGDHNHIIQLIARFQAEIEAATIERCAVAAIGEKVDAPEMQQDTDAEYNSGIDDAVQAIRNLKGQTS